MFLSSFIALQGTDWNRFILICLENITMHRNKRNNLAEYPPLNYRDISMFYRPLLAGRLH